MQWLNVEDRRMQKNVEENVNYFRERVYIWITMRLIYPIINIFEIQILEVMIQNSYDRNYSFRVIDYSNFFQFSISYRDQKILFRIWFINLFIIFNYYKL